MYSTDINECQAMPPHCEQNCRNTPGSFACSCRLGYSLANNQLSCIGEFAMLYTCRQQIGVLSYVSFLNAKIVF